MPWEILTHLLQRGVGSRSTVLATLTWMMAVLIAGLVGTVTAHAANWIEFLFAAMLCINFSAFIIAYAYFAMKDPDALRSEKYSLEKMAIERGVYGDSSTGIIEHARPQTPLLPVAIPESETGP